MNYRIQKLLKKEKEILNNTKDINIIIEIMSQINLFHQETTFEEFLDYFKKVDSFDLKENEKKTLKGQIGRRLLAKTKSLKKLIEFENIIDKQLIIELILLIFGFYTTNKEKEGSLDYIEKEYGSFDQFVKDAYEFAEKNISVKNRNFFAKVIEMRYGLKDGSRFILDDYYSGKLFSQNKLILSEKLILLLRTFVFAKNYERLNELKTQLESIYSEYENKEIKTYEDLIFYENLVVAINSIEIYVKSLLEKKDDKNEGTRTS